MAPPVSGASSSPLRGLLRKNRSSKTEEPKPENSAKPADKDGSAPSPEMRSIYEKDVKYSIPFLGRGSEGISRRDMRAAKRDAKANDPEGFAKGSFPLQKKDGETVEIIDKKHIMNKDGDLVAKGKGTLKDGGEASNKKNWAIAGVGIVGVGGAATGYYFYQKKKEDDAM